MNSRKLFSLILGVFSVAVVVSLPAFSTNHPWGDGQITGSPRQPQVTDGGGPAPPYPLPPSFGMIPPKPNFGVLVADGGGPAPPYPPPPSFGMLVADGGGPAPPYPPKPSFGMLVADGGGPAPPYPPKPSSGMLVADGGGPAPPYPKPPVATFGSLLAV